MMRVIERVEGRYEVEDAPFGKVYAWREGYVEIECGCGDRANLTVAETLCGCGADHEGAVREALVAEGAGDEEAHPWRYDERISEDGGLPY